MMFGRIVASTARQQAGIAGGRNQMLHTLPKLPYEYNALEPIISKEIMEIHHTKHHQTYVTNLNAAEETLKTAIAKNDVTKVISLAGALRFNGGGHINHSIFWNNLTPKKTEPTADFKKALETRWGSVENFKKDLSAQTVGIQGSGWGWLGFNKGSKQLQIIAMANQDPLEASTGLVPILGIDVWEHAYYLQYQNLRPKYVEAIFDIVNWEDLSQRFANAKA